VAIWRLMLPIASVNSASAPSVTTEGNMLAFFNWSAKSARTISPKSLVTSRRAEGPHARLSVGIATTFLILTERMDDLASADNGTRGGRGPAQLAKSAPSETSTAQPATILGRR